MSLIFCVPNQDGLSLWIVEPVRISNGGDVIDAPADHDQEEQGREKSNPQRNRYQGIAVPIVSKSEKQIVNLLGDKTGKTNFIVLFSRKG